jgi:Protein of unknown function (DUF4232)
MSRSGQGAQRTPGRRFRWHRVLCVTAAVSVAVAMAAGPAWARPAGGNAPRLAAAACRPGQLRISIPAAIAGDPDAAPAQLVWNVVLRNPGRSLCSLRGWPGMLVRRSSGRAAAATVTDVRFSNLAYIPAKRVVLRPGQSAVVTVVGPAQAPGCVTRWSLGLALPGAADRVTVRQPANAAGICVGGTMRVSPFYSLRSLQRSIRALTAPAQNLPFSSTTGTQTPACKAAALRARVSAAATQRAGSVIVLRLSADTRCVLLSGGWPTVRLHMSGGASPIAKALPYQPAWSMRPTPYVTQQQAGQQRTAVALRPGTSASVALVSTAPGACRPAQSATVYPSAVGLGAGVRVTFARPVRVCGQLRVLPFLPGGLTASALSVARGALAAAGGDQNSAAAPAGGSPAGFWSGSDGPRTMTCGAGPYTIMGPDGNCFPAGGYYGGYLGEIGRWDEWASCDSVSRGWNSTDYADAQANFVTFHDGLGAAAYWMMAGPGRDPDPASASTATAWGQLQAQQVAAELSGITLSLPYVLMDIEAQTQDGLANGWNESWTAACSTQRVLKHIPARIDRDDFNGFRHYIKNNTPWLPGVYSAGGRKAHEWDGIFGTSQTLASTAEWTYENATGSIATYPASFSIPGTRVTADWFAGSPPPARCELFWQWTGGSKSNDITNYRVDELDGNRVLGRCN